MTKPYFEVDVPIRNSSQPGLRGLHVFTGRAPGRSEALAAAHAVYDQAARYAAAGQAIPSTSSDGWTARGFRPGWVLEWHKATAKAWANPNNLL